MTEHESREALERDVDDDIGELFVEYAERRAHWREKGEAPPDWGEYVDRARAAFERLPVAPVVGEREADHQRAIRGFDDDGKPVCICGLTFWSDDVCVDCGDTENAAYSRMARRRTLAARTPEEGRR